jgi:archaellum biogenesis ATPase FlaH
VAKAQTVLQAAILAAKAGYPVFPVLVTVDEEGTKDVQPLGKWTQISTDDPVKLKRVWSYKANAYGIDTGKAGLCVVDLDTHNGQDGAGNWADLLPDSPEPTVNTPSGGQHVYFRDSTGELRNSAGELAEGVDVRGNGGLVIGPGSVLTTGTYTGTLPRLEEVPEAPEALRVLIRSRKAGPKPETTPSGQPLGEPGQGVALARELLAVANAEGGTRNHQLNKSAFALGQIVTGGGLREDVVRAALEEVAREAGLDTDEIRKTIDSGFASAQDNPRNVQQTPEDLFTGLDLAEWFSTDHPAPPRFGLGHLIYEGSVHIIAGEPASGKSVLCYQWAIDAMRAGKRAVLLDEEAGPRDALGKLVALGASEELLKDRLTYLKPSGRNLDRLATQLHALVSSGDVGVVVVDSLGAALAIAGRPENDNGEVGGFLTSVVLPLAERYGVTVLLIDHKTKGDTGRYSRGASIKLQLTAVQLAVVATQPFSKDKDGVMTIECNKNRFGDYAEGDRWTVDVSTGNGKILLDVQEFTKAQEHTAFITAADTLAVARAFRAVSPRHLPIRTLEVPGVGRDVARTIASQLRIRGVLEYVKGDTGPIRWKDGQTVLAFPEEALAEAAS